MFRKEENEEDGFAVVGFPNYKADSKLIEKLSNRQTVCFLAKINAVQRVQSGLIEIDGAIV